MTLVTKTHLRLLTVLGAFVAVLSMGLASPAAQAAPGAASVLKGTWIGTYSGYSNDGYYSGQEKFIITSVKGSNARGTWQSRSNPKAKWGKPKPLNLSIYAQENDDAMPTDYISGGDADGIYVGKLETSENRMNFSYTSWSKNLLVLTLAMKKKE
jgi:hypothetical protein